jgi:hypothetical protein
MIESEGPEADIKVYVLHHAVVPRRTDLPLLETCARLLDRVTDREVEIGIVESIFDYQERPWYGNSLRPPRPPAWETAESAALRFILELAGRLQARNTLPAELKTAIDDTAATIRRILDARRQ